VEGAARFFDHAPEARRGDAPPPLLVEDDDFDVRRAPAHRPPQRDGACDAP
jgi:hypothetical protein